jgi:hypothetical protein
MKLVIRMPIKLLGNSLDGCTQASNDTSCDIGVLLIAKIFKVIQGQLRVLDGVNNEFDYSFFSFTHDISFLVIWVTIMPQEGGG